MLDNIQFSKVNQILSEWDPIGVGYPISLDEYRIYIPDIVSAIKREIELRAVIVSMLNNMGVHYNAEDTFMRNDIDAIISKLKSAC